MKYINIGQINSKFLIPVFGGLINLVFKFFIKYNPKYGIIGDNPFLFDMYIYLSLIFSFIPFLILKRKSKRLNLITNEQIKNNDLYKKFTENKNVIKKNKFKKYRFIFYSTIFDLIQTLILTLYIPNCVYNMWIFDIIFISIFSYLFLQAIIYKHQYISMIFIIIFGFGLNIIAYFKLGDEEDKIKPLEIFIKFLSEICFCLSIVIIKYNLEKNYCNPYEACIWQGVYGFILHSIILAIFCGFELSAYGIKHPDNLKKYFNEFNYNDFVVFLAIVIVHFVYNICIFLTCDYFTPTHILICSIIKETNLYLQPNSNWTLNIIGIVLLILIAFMFLIFIEVIEINIFKISYNTKKNIESRSKHETLIEFTNILASDDELKFDEEGLIRDTI